MTSSEPYNNRLERAIGELTIGPNYRAYSRLTAYLLGQTQPLGYTALSIASILNP